ncbi:cytochrome P450 [Pseudonocardia sp. TRM90224]|uniref:cytochrome P450 n=1 Tax=Pseudonocardia sp. TRM90224 TaxID=2812678 RepID=UPI001E42163F|nr:cytochrome P450 [Pseudonocardia sp. TRM90224]
MSSGATVRREIRDYPFEVFRGDLPDELLQMVEHEKVSRVRLPGGRLVWLVLGYDEVSEVLTDVRFRRSGGPFDTGAEVTDGCPVRNLGMDGAAHAGLRRLAARAFTPRRIEAFRSRIQAITDELLDAMVERGSPGDLVADLVVPLPAIVISELLGVPAADRERFAQWDTAMMAVDTHAVTETADPTRAMRAYLGARLAEKRAAPGTDLLSAWVEAQADDPSLTDEEIIGLAVTVLVGGREISSISVGMRALFQHPDVMQRLRADPGLIPPAVDELLRFTSLSPTFFELTVVAPVELGGVALQAGDVVMPLPWAANRDPAKFPEPDLLRLDRPWGQHLTFGTGSHFCLGAALGRMEVEIAIATLLRRFPHLRPAVEIDELPWRHERINCGLKAFPVAWA